MWMLVNSQYVNVVYFLYPTAVNSQRKKRNETQTRRCTHHHYKVLKHLILEYMLTVCFMYSNLLY